MRVLCIITGSDGVIVVEPHGGCLWNAIVKDMLVDSSFCLIVPLYLVVYEASGVPI